MKTTEFTFVSSDALEIHVYQWEPEERASVRGIVQIAHGMVETADRYERLAKRLTSEGFAVYINDHRGHGKTAKVVENVGHLAEKEGFKLMVEDVHRLTAMIKEAYPGLPVFLLGHSMGSFVTQRYIGIYGNELAGAILSGTNGKQGIALTAASYLINTEVKKYGRKYVSHKLDKASFGTYNAKFEPRRTEFDWLSRDTAEVDLYINNPFCGKTVTVGFFEDLINGLKLIQSPSNLEGIPKSLPIYLFSGDMDPVGRYGKGVMKLIQTYRTIGIRNISFKLYPGGRHEMLNEINREEVMDDLIRWLNKIMEV